MQNNQPNQNNSHQNIQQQPNEIQEASNIPQQQQAQPINYQQNEVPFYQYNQFQINQNEIPSQYPKQWQYFNQNLYSHQFLDKHQFFQAQLTELEAMGFDKRGRNIGLLRKFNGDITQVVEKLVQKQNMQKEKKKLKLKNQILKDDETVDENNLQINKIENTLILIVDCNNVFYANREMMKECNYRIKQKRLLKMFLKQLLLLTQNYQNKIINIKLIWDKINFKQLEYKDLESQILKSQSEEFQFKPRRLKIMKHMISFKQQIHNQIFNKQQKIESRQSITIYLEQEGKDKIKIDIQCAIPQFPTADDMIVNEVQNLPDIEKFQTTVITSDKNLRLRLEEQGIQQFIGNGAWQRLEKRQEDDNQKQQYKQT